MASYLTVVMVCIANAMCPVQFDDTKGFHTGPLPVALQQCYLRGAPMVKEIASRTPVLTAITVCVDVEDKTGSSANGGQAQEGRSTQGEDQRVALVFAESVINGGKVGCEGYFTS